MARRRRSKRRRVGKIAAAVQSRRNEIGGFTLVAVSLILFLSLISYDKYDTGLHTSDPNTIRNNVCGIVGAYLAEGLFFPFGLASFVLPGALAYWAWRVFFGVPRHERWIKLGGLTLLMLALTAVLAVFEIEWNGSVFSAGGLVGYYLDQKAEIWFGPVGSRVLSVSLVLIGLLLTTDLLLFNMVVRALTALGRAAAWALAAVGRCVPGVWQWTAAQAGAWRRRGGELLARRRRAAAETGAHPRGRVMGVFRRANRPRGRPRIIGAAEPAAANGSQGAQLLDSPEQYDYEDTYAEREDRSGTPLRAAGAPESETEAPVRGFSGRVQIRPLAADADEDADAEAEAEAPRRTAVEEFALSMAERTPDRPKRRRQRHGAWTLPPIDLYTESQISPHAPTRADFEEQAARLEHALETFGIEAEVLDVVRGPTITRFELRLAPGIKVSRVLALQDDLALAMEALRVRIEAPIPGRAAIGIEIPNAQRDEVRLRDVLTSKPYKGARSALSLALGKDIAGAPVVADLAAMPHLLIAGATGAGKTVCVNALISSLLHRNSPETLRLLLVDPKMIELSQYEGIPHLLWPVVTDAKQAGNYLQWLVREMESRYARLAKARTRNIQAYNELVEENLAEGHQPPEDDEPDDPHTPTTKLPYIVAVIDELADLMMVSPKEVEDAIARLAQLARAVGIHLILATQRPSVDVLTGVIKANFPARISFAVRSKVDSRTVLDSNGAEQLIGRGDCLYLPAGHSRPVRVQSALVSDREIGALVEHYAAQGQPEYVADGLELQEDGPPGSTLDTVDDDLFVDAVKLVLTSGQASISMLQRRLRVGYARAARLVDMMELQGIVGPGEGSKPREILVGLEFLERLNDPSFA